MLKRKIPSQTFWAAAIGTMVEYYDYALFTIFLPIIAPVFFSASSSYDSLIKSFNVFLIAMLARPLGGIFFGYLGDNFGRRIALITSMYGIAFATILIGLIPSSEIFGIWSIIILIVAKTLQIFCFGGEYNGAGIYVVEHAHKENEAYMGSLLSAATLCGSLGASLIGVIITLSWMPTWSWRLAFILGGIVGIIGIVYRKNLSESPYFKHAKTSQDLKKLIANFPSEIIAGIFIGGFATVPFTTVLAFISPVLLTQGFFTKQEFMLIQSLLITIAIITLAVAGKAADKKSPVKVMKLACLMLVFLSYPVLLMLDKLSLVGFLIAAITLIICNEMLLGPSNALLKNLFPMEYRYRGSSLSFTIGMSLFGGLTPITESYLYQWHNHFSTIALWPIFLGSATWLAINLSTLKQTKQATERLQDF